MAALYLFKIAISRECLVFLINCFVFKTANTIRRAGDRCLGAVREMEEGASVWSALHGWEQSSWGPALLGHCACFSGCTGPSRLRWVLSTLWSAGLGCALQLCLLVISVVAEHRLWGVRLSRCGSQFLPSRCLALVVHGMWGLLRLGIEPVSLALQGEFLTREVPVHWFLISLVYGLLVYTLKII